MNENPSISSLKKNGKSILIDWSDGEQSKFNFLWLKISEIDGGGVIQFNKLN